MCCPQLLRLPPVAARGPSWDLCAIDSGRSVGEMNTSSNGTDVIPSDSAMPRRPMYSYRGASCFSYCLTRWSGA